VISLGTPGKNDWAIYWAHLGLGDVQVARGGSVAEFWGWPGSGIIGAGVMG